MIVMTESYISMSSKTVVIFIDNLYQITCDTITPLRNNKMQLDLLDGGYVIINYDDLLVVESQ